MKDASNVALFEYSDPDGTWTTQDVVKAYLSSIGIDTKVQTWVCQAGVAIKEANKRGESASIRESDYIPAIW